MNDRPRLGPAEWDALVAAARLGDERAWEHLVDRLSGAVWKVLMSYQLGEHDREDAYASTFFQLYRHLGEIKEPYKLPGWISTTARNEANAVWRKRGRAVPTETIPLRNAVFDPVEERVLDDETLRLVLEAFGQLPARGQALLRLLTAVPPMTYEAISSMLDMPVGSIGPTAGRLIARLRKALHVHDDSIGGQP